jgi:hypothetical protein
MFGERRPCNGVQTVTIDYGGPIESCIYVIDLNLSGETPNRRGDLNNGYPFAHVQHFGACQDQHWPRFLPDLR